MLQLLKTKEQGEEMARIVVENIPDNIRNRFKSYCALNETTMRDALIAFMDGVSGARDPAEILKAISGPVLTMEKIKEEAFPGIEIEEA